MPEIRVFEPALCCETGVCGPEPDQALVTFTADMDHLRSLGADIARHNLATDPSVFDSHDAARRLLDREGPEGLPLTLVDDITAQAGAYPTRDQLLRYAKLGPPRESASACVSPGLMEAVLAGKDND